MRDSLKYIHRGNHQAKQMIGAEIGVQAGVNALNMLQNMHLERLYLVDTWASGCIDPYQKMLDNLQPFMHKIEIIQKTSEEASKQFEDDFFDFVYIDADHSYASVQTDMRVWLPKVKKGGFLCGHDFDNHTTPAVKSAVTDFCHARKLFLMPCDDIDWLVPIS